MLGSGPIGRIIHRVRGEPGATRLVIMILLIGGIALIVPGYRIALTPQNTLALFASFVFILFLGSATLNSDEVKNSVLRKTRLVPGIATTVILEFVALGLILGYFFSLLLLPGALIVGNEAPLGIVRDVINPELSNSPEWVINIGGIATSPDNYEGGLQIPLFIIVLGATGGYINFLSKMTYLLNLEVTIGNLRMLKKSKGGEIARALANPIEGDLSAKQKLKFAAIRVKHSEMLMLLTEFMLAPILAIAVYLLLVQGGATSPVTAGIASLAAALAVGRILNALSNALSGVLQKAEPTEVRGFRWRE